MFKPFLLSSHKKCHVVLTSAARRTRRSVCVYVGVCVYIDVCGVALCVPYKCFRCFPKLPNSTTPICEGMFLIEIVTMIAFDWKEIIYLKKNENKEHDHSERHVSKYIQSGFCSALFRLTIVLLSTYSY